jgi:predicted PurR-regulated permease PerM
MSYPAPNYAQKQYHPGPDAKSRLTGPAIGMIASAILSMLGAIFAIGYGVFIFAMVDKVPELIEKEQQRSGQQMTAEQKAETEAAKELIGTFGKGYAIFILVLGAVSMLMAIFILYGSMQMMKVQSYGMSMVAAVMCILPFGGCWLLSMPMGIWGLVVLMDERVKRAFR